SREIQKEFERNPAPALHTLIQLQQLIIFQLRSRAEGDSTILRLVNDLLRPIMAWATLEQKKVEHELTKQKYEDKRQADKEAADHAQRRAKGGGGIRPETLAEIERELRLM